MIELIMYAHEVNAKRQARRELRETRLRIADLEKELRDNRTSAADAANAAAYWAKRCEELKEQE